MSLVIQTVSALIIFFYAQFLILAGLGYEPAASENNVDEAAESSDDEVIAARA